MSIKTINSQLPRVAICVPVRNGARTIQRTLDSLLNQDYPNYEIIVSDNYSNDDTANIVSQYASNGVKYFFNPVLEKWGAESNWNHILTLAEGPFIALYHADDIYTPTMVQRQVDFFLKYPEASAVFAMTQTIDEYDRPIKRGNIKLPQEVYQPLPSPRCPRGTEGRIAIFEVMKITKELEEIILKEPNEIAIFKEARKQGMITMREDAIIKVLKGVIGFEELEGIV